MAKVGIVMGSDSDMPMMTQATAFLKKMGIEYEVYIISAHREPDVFFKWTNGAKECGLSVIIVGTSKATYLLGMCTALFSLPVIGIPMKTSGLDSVDSLYPIVQMPSGIPRVTVAINGGKDASILVVKILAADGKALEEKLQTFQKEMRDEVIGEDRKLQHEGYQNSLK